MGGSITDKPYKVLIGATVWAEAFHGSQAECEGWAENVMNKPYTVTDVFLLDTKITSVSIEPA